MLILLSFLIGTAGAQNATSAVPLTASNPGPVVSSAAPPPANATTSSVPSQGTILPSPTTVSTAVPSASDPAAVVPGQDNPPKPQWWCGGGGNVSYCPGDLLQDVQLSGVFGDSKTFVDRPTNGSQQQVFAAWTNASSGNVTAGQIVDFVNAHFTGEGQELAEVAIQRGNASENATSGNITDQIYSAWVDKVDSYWDLLIRESNASRLCNGTNCDSSLIPLNNTIVVPGGRYREVYYWDSYWILQGLLASKLDYYAWALLQNFMDLIEDYGFIPNGGRKYYLNRSQPPVFVQMVAEYVKQTGNITILERALPSMERELAWWHQNRTMQVTSPFSGKNFTVAHFAVNNSAPRPEGYVEDFLTANEAQPPLNQSQKEDLYAELASGAESGWDYSARWLTKPVANTSDNEEALRSLNVRGIVPVDLMALMAGNHALLADMYEHWERNKGSLNATQTNNTGESGTNMTNGAGGWGNTGVNQTSNVPQPQQPPQATNQAAGAQTANQRRQAAGQNTGTQNGQGAAQNGTPGGQDTGGGWGKTQTSGNQTTGTTGTGTNPTNGAGAGTNMTNGAGGNATIASKHRDLAKQFKDAILDLNWDANRTFFYDFNATSGTRTPFYTAAGFFPLWQNITPSDLDQDQALKMFSGTRFLLKKYDGPPTAATYLVSGLNWDFPNVWPPHVYTTIKALETIERVLNILPAAQNGTAGTGNTAANSNSTNSTTSNSPAPGRNLTTSGQQIRTLPQLSLSNFSEVVPQQLGLNESELPEQPTTSRGNVTYGNVTQHLISAEAGKLPWTQGLALEIAARYMNSAFCSWYSTGGELNGTLQRLPLSELNASGTYHEEPGVEGGKMFEKFNITDLDAAGGGGEYTVQVGFGWTNGVVLWAAKRFGQYLRTPTCPLILITPNLPQPAGNNTVPGGGMNGTAVPGPASSNAPPANDSPSSAVPGPASSSLPPANNQVTSNVPTSATPPPANAVTSNAPTSAPSQLAARSFMFVGRRVNN